MKHPAFDTALATLSVAILATVAAHPARADTHHFELPDLGTFEDFIAEIGSTSFQGNGFVGMYNDRWSHHGITWSHSLDLNNANDGRTVMQLNLAPLAGQQVVSATLSFRILDGQDAPNWARVRFSGFDNGAGALGLTWDAPASAIGWVEHDVFNGSSQSQSFDITALLSAGVAGGSSWLGLHLQNQGGGQLATRTYEFLEELQYAVIDLDRAQVRIDVVTVPVPEPGAWALLLAGGSAVAWVKRRRALYDAAHRRGSP